MSYGPHLHLDLERASFKHLNDVAVCRKFLDMLPGLINMTKITRPKLLRWEPGTNLKEHGITGMVIIAESHISIHTYPHRNYAFIDVFSCKPFDIEKAKGFAQTMFKPEFIDSFVYKRGKNFEEA